MNTKRSGFWLLSLLVSFSGGCAADDPTALLLPPDATLLVYPSDVSPFANSGLKSFTSIQQAMNMAQPGDTLVLMPGEYFQDVQSVRDGLADKPIQIKGMPGAVVKGAGATSIFDIRHSYIEMSHFIINGLFDETGTENSYRKKLVYVKGLKDKGVKGVRLLYMDIKNARDECVRIKYLAQYNEVAYSSISYCGAQDYKFSDGTKNHNGEAIYIGTAPEQIKEGKNPTLDIDQSDYNWVHDNVIEPYASECIDVKEGSRFNLIENNICKYEKDLNVGGISIRGNNNIIRYNHVSSNLGAGIRLGGDERDDGINNEVYGNYLENNKNSGLKIMRSPQGKICDNTIVPASGSKAIRVEKQMDPALYNGKCESN